MNKETREFFSEMKKEYSVNNVVKYFADDLDLAISLEELEPFDNDLKRIKITITVEELPS